MKTLVVGLALCVATVSLAGDLGFSGKGSTNAVSAGGGTLNSNLAYYVVPVGEMGGAAVEYLNVTSDLNAGQVNFRSESNRLTLSAASSGATNKLYVASGGAAFGSDAIAVLRHISTGTAPDRYERLIVLGSTATVITLTNATAVAVAKGDTIHLMIAAGSLPVGNNCVAAPPSKEFAPPRPLFRAEPGDPLLVEVSGAGTNVYSINAVSGRYDFQEVKGEIIK